MKKTGRAEKGLTKFWERSECPGVPVVILRADFFKEIHNKLVSPRIEKCLNRLLLMHIKVRLGYTDDSFFAEKNKLKTNSKEQFFF